MLHVKCPRNGNTKTGAQLCIGGVITLSAGLWRFEFEPVSGACLDFYHIKRTLTTPLLYNEFQVVVNIVFYTGCFKVDIPPVVMFLYHRNNHCAMAHKIIVGPMVLAC